jgi:hypothetical protein
MFIAIHPPLPSQALIGALLAAGHHPVPVESLADAARKEPDGGWRAIVVEVGDDLGLALGVQSLHRLDLFDSDRLFDRPLLHAVAHPVAVNPDARLAAYATVRRWPVVWFDVPPGVPKVAGLIEPQRLVVSRLEVPAAGLSQPLRLMVIGDLQPAGPHEDKERIEAIVAEADRALAQS